MRRSAWLAANAASFGADAARLAIGGDSAGGGLAANVALRARDTGGPPIMHQLLVYPAVADHGDSPSTRAYGNGHGLTIDRMAFYWNCYIPRPELADLPYVLADKAASLRGLPPATLIIAECDPLHDMGVAYAERLRADGVPVELHVYARDDPRVLLLYCDLRQRPRSRRHRRDRPAKRCVMIHVVAVITANPGQRDNILDALRANVPLVRAEVGCIEYEAVVDAGGFGSVQAKLGPDVFVVIEKWESADALKAHAASPHMAAYGAATKDWVAGRLIHVLSPA